MTRRVDFHAPAAHNACTAHTARTIDQGNLMRRSTSWLRRSVFGVVVIAAWLWVVGAAGATALVYVRGGGGASSLCTVDTAVGSRPKPFVPHLFLGPDFWLHISPTFSGDGPLLAFSRMLVP